MRRKNYIKQLSKKDEFFFKVLKNCQHISENQALSLLAKNRLQNCVKQKILSKQYLFQNGKAESIYFLTSNGTSWIMRNFPHFQGGTYSAPTAPSHNILLSKLVIENMREGREWLNEKSLREILLSEINMSDNRFELLRKLENREISVPDGACVREDGTIQCFEVVTSSYNSEAIQAKMAFSEITQLPIEFIRS